MIEDNKASGRALNESDDEDNVRGARDRDRLSLFGGRNDLEYFEDELDEPPTTKPKTPSATSSGEKKKPSSESRESCLLEPNEM